MSRPIIAAVAIPAATALLLGGTGLANADTKHTPEPIRAVSIIGGPDIQSDSKLPRWAIDAGNDKSDVMFINGQPKRVPKGEATTLAAEPTDSGFLLPKGFLQDPPFVWKQADTIKIIAYRPSDGSILAQVNMTGIKERLVGGTSDRWEYTWTANYVKGVEFAQDYWYRCALNIRNDTDHYCDGYQYPNGSKDAADKAATGLSHPLGTQTTPMTINKAFGKSYASPPRNNSQIIKFAMIKIRTNWPVLGVTDELKIRFWDTCIAKARFYAQLCPTSGDGGSGNGGN